MIQIEIDNVPVELKPQDRNVFAQLTHSLLPGMVEGKKILELLCSIVADGSKRGIPHDNATLQAALWAMYQIGVRAIRINQETNQADLRTEPVVEFDKQPFESHFTIGNITTGRAVVAALLFFTTRAVRVNSEMRTVTPQPLERMQKTNQLVTQSRLAGEEMHVTAIRYFVRMVEEGHSADSFEMKSALQVVADLSVASFSFDTKAKTINLEGFNEANPCALGYLQNFDPEQISQMRQRVAAMNVRMRGALTPTAQPLPPARRRRT